VIGERLDYLWFLDYGLDEKVPDHTTMNAFEAAEKNGRAADLQRELEELFASQNKSPSKDATSIPATFLRVTVAL
jgi:hypothetical protein